MTIENQEAFRAGQGLIESAAMPSIVADLRAFYETSKYENGRLSVEVADSGTAIRVEVSELPGYRCRSDGGVLDRCAALTLHGLRNVTPPRLFQVLDRRMVFRGCHLLDSYLFQAGYLPSM